MMLQPLNQTERQAPRDVMQERGLVMDDEGKLVPERERLARRAYLPSAAYAPPDRRGDAGGGVLSS